MYNIHFAIHAVINVGVRLIAHRYYKGSAEVYIVKIHNRRVENNNFLLEKRVVLK